MNNIAIFPITLPLIIHSDILRILFSKNLKLKSLLYKIIQTLKYFVETPLAAVIA